MIATLTLVAGTVPVSGNQLTESKVESASVIVQDRVKVVKAHYKLILLAVLMASLFFIIGCVSGTYMRQGGRLTSSGDDKTRLELRLQRTKITELREIFHKLGFIRDSSSLTKQLLMELLMRFAADTIVVLEASEKGQFEQE